MHLPEQFQKQTLLYVELWQENLMGVEDFDGDWHEDVEWGDTGIQS